MLSDGGSGPSRVAAGVVSAALRDRIERLAIELLRTDNEAYAMPALELLVTCIYVGEFENAIAFDGC